MLFLEIQISIKAFKNYLQLYDDDIVLGGPFFSGDDPWKKVDGVIGKIFSKLN